ncbi:hypothetical protein BSKO_03364 [Bryopsis sp. KO-2023]|nr:hypothetical protein BSKO_03364 [Bryopsis sp. KO-2023]
MHPHSKTFFRGTTLRHWGGTRPGRFANPRAGQVQCLKIDRGKHLENAWRRQQDEEARLCREMKGLSGKSVVEVKSLNQHDTVLDKAGNSLVVVFFYSRACGSCKEVLKSYEALSQEYRRQNASVIFTKHDVLDEFDHRSDITRMYQVRAVPSFGFFAGGALVTRLVMRDTRGIRGKMIRTELLRDRKKLADTLRQLLFRFAPSAMK